MNDSMDKLNQDPAEVEKFSRLQEEWWDVNGAFKTLHAINSLRLDYVNQRCSIDNKNVLDVGCGGGIFFEKKGKTKGKGFAI